MRRDVHPPAVASIPADPRGEPSRRIGMPFMRVVDHASCSRASKMRMHPAAANAIAADSNITTKGA